MTRVLGVLLAGGLSRRMGGGDKGLIPLGEKPVLEHALERLQAMCDPVVINANGDPNRFAAYGLPVLPDQISGFAGPLAGVHAALAYAAAQEHPPGFVLSAAADTPFFPDNLLTHLLDQAKSPETIVLATSNGRRHPVFGLWPVTHVEDLGQWLQDPCNRKVLAWVDRHPWSTADFAMHSNTGGNLDPFFNINTPDDLESARNFLETYPS